MTELLPVYGTLVTIIALLVTFYAIKIFFKERKRRIELKGTMRCFVLAAICFAIVGLFLGVNYMDASDNILLQSAPQLFYVLGFIFLLLGGRNFKKFSDALHADQRKLKKDLDEN